MYRDIFKVMGCVWGSRFCSNQHDLLSNNLSILEKEFIVAKLEKLKLGLHAS